MADSLPDWWYELKNAEPEPEDDWQEWFWQCAYWDFYHWNGRLSRLQSDLPYARGLQR